MFTNTHQKRLSTRLVHGWFILLILVLVVSLLPQTASATSMEKASSAKEEECSRTYEVRRGDTLAKIALWYGMPAGQIVELSGMRKPYTIYVGQRLCIPKKAEKGALKLASRYTDAYAVYFAAGRAGDDVLIYIYNYPKTDVLVKVDNASDLTWKLVTVGDINTAKLGNNRLVRMKLPAELRQAKYLFVCLKDQTTSNLQCVYPRSGG
jgi:LysM repeat protein